MGIKLLLVKSRYSILNNLFHECVILLYTLYNMVNNIHPNQGQCSPADYILCGIRHARFAGKCKYCRSHIALAHPLENLTVF